MTLSFSQFLGLLANLVGGVVATVLISPLAIWAARRSGLMDIPGAAAHKQHARPTPLAGGIALACSLVALLSIFRLWEQPFTALMLAMGIVFIFGVWDDARGLSAAQKMFGQVLASVVMIASGNYIKFLSGFPISFLSPDLLTFLNWIITVIWLVGISNSINLIDSMDGLALGVTAIAFAFFIGLTLVAGQTSLARFCAILLGVCLGLYVFNMPPARLFLGDSGAQTLGFILASVAFLYTPNNFPQASSWFVPIMVLGMPIFDTTLVVVSRLHRRRPIFQADRSHIYHRLVELGLDPGRAVLSVHAVSLVLNFLAFIALYRQPWQANLIFGLSVLAGIGLLIFLIRKSIVRGESNG
jgi:UDP-GlcNAc:undecaprenyl-phosphate/decaprenyl-phosphate GlcNAc-1-phosphate transferase